MLFDVGEEGADHEKGGEKGGGRSEKEEDELTEGEGKAEFQELDEGIAQHHGDCEKKGKFRGGGAADAQAQGADHGGAGTGGARNDGKGLKKPDEQGVGEAQILDAVYARRFVFLLNENEKGAVENEGGGDDQRQ